jgi:hypothetical protein
LILSKDAFSPAEAGRILDYCAEDARLTERLLLKMLPTLDLTRALWRGKYAWVAAAQSVGVPMQWGHLSSAARVYPPVWQSRASLYAAASRECAWSGFHLAV